MPLAAYPLESSSAVANLKLQLERYYLGYAFQDVDSPSVPADNRIPNPSSLDSDIFGLVSRKFTKTVSLANGWPASQTSASSNKS